MPPAFDSCSVQHPKGKRPRAWHLLMIIFWASATFSGGISIARSPRATMTPARGGRGGHRVAREGARAGRAGAGHCANSRCMQPRGSTKGPEASAPHPNPRKPPPLGTICLLQDLVKVTHASLQGQEQQQRTHVRREAVIGPPLSVGTTRGAATGRARGFVSMRPRTCDSILQMILMCAPPASASFCKGVVCGGSGGLGGQPGHCAGRRPRAKAA